MRTRRDRTLDQVVLLDALREFVRRGLHRVRAADLARLSAELGHWVPKKFVRRRLSENGDGRTPISQVGITEQPNGRFWFSYVPSDPTFTAT